MDRSATLSSDEIRIERLCEEERYLELHTDIAEKAIQEEEELKRLNMELSETDGYQAVGFSYDQNGEPKSSATAPAEDTQADEEDDMEFIPPPQLNLPRSMSHPSGTKLNALIEKTAKYVSTHGGQMEIMIKTKQAANPQFAFLNFEHHLNPYYKHQVFMIKSGRYRPEIHNKPPPPKPKEEPADDSNSDDDDDDEDVGYLHPSLRAKSSTAGGPSLTTSNSAPSLPQLSQAQLEETPYGRLMKRLAEHQPSLTNSPQRTATPTLSDTDSTSQTGFPADYSSTTHPTEAYFTDQSYTGAHQYDAYYQQYYLQQGYGAPPPPQTAPPPPQRPVSPPDEFKPLIERLLTYVKKDGEAFEKQVLQRNDPRFSFLQPGDANFEYYKWRKEQIILAKLQTNSGTDSPLLGAGRSASSKGVSFSIKQKEPETTSIDTSRVALPVDPESDEEGNENSDGVSARAPAESPFTPSIYQGPLPAPPPSTVAEKPALSQEEMQRKQADQKLRDKLAAAAREKMTQVTLHTKDKDLQAARKLKAAMFINMLKSKDKSKQTTIGPELPPKDTPSAESRLSQEPEVHDYDHGRPRSRSPPSAYTVRVNRDRKSSSHRQSGQSRHKQDEYRPHHSSSSSSRSRDHTRDNSPHQSRRRHRSPSPVQSIIKRRKSKSPTTSRGASYSHSRSATDYQRNDAVQSSHETSSYEEQTNSNSADNNEFMSKVRQMLKANRQKVYKEDLYGD